MEVLADKLNFLFSKSIEVLFERMGEPFVSILPLIMFRFKVLIGTFGTD